MAEISRMGPRQSGLGREEALRGELVVGRNHYLSQAAALTTLNPYPSAPREGGTEKGSPYRPFPKDAGRKSSSGLDPFVLNVVST